MANKIVYLVDLSRRDGSSLRLRNGLGNKSMLLHDRTEIQNVFDLDDLDANLAGVAKFEVEKQSCPTFSAALQHAANCVEQNADNMITIRDKNDDVVCHVMI